MKTIIIIVSLFLAVTVFADPKLYHYTDKATGEERGICYSDKDGNPQDNPLWNHEEIFGDLKDYYIKLQREQIDSKPKSKDKVMLLEERISILEAASAEKIN